MGLTTMGLASPVPSPVLLADVFSVKTTGLFHNTRLPVLLATWLPEAGRSVHLFTDAPPSSSLANSLKATGAEMVETGCPSDHSRSALCCKMQAELAAFLNSPAREDWFCWTMTTTCTLTASSTPWLASQPRGDNSTTLESLPSRGLSISLIEGSLHQVRFDSHLEPEALVSASPGLLYNVWSPSSSWSPGSKRWGTPSGCPTTSPSVT